VVATPPVKEAPDVVILVLLISKPAETVADDNDKVPDDLTLNCNFVVSSLKTICGSEFPVVPVGYIITLGIMLICFQVR
jgi:hypothetical protein